MRLFVYGTLHPDHAPPAVLPLVRRLGFISEARVNGTLFDLGAYPGLVLGSRGVVTGSLCDVPDDPALLKALDDYEGVCAEHPHLSLFQRVTCELSGDESPAAAVWTYVYNRDTSGLPVIAGGRWQPSRAKAGV